MGWEDKRERVCSLNVVVSSARPQPHLSLALLPHSLVCSHAAVGPSRVPGVEDLPGVSIQPGWTQKHTEESLEGEGKDFS